MLHAKLLRSPHPHARIVAIDVTRAQQHPGVHLVLTGQGFPGHVRHHARCRRTNIRSRPSGCATSAIRSRPSSRRTSRPPPRPLDLIVVDVRSPADDRLARGSARAPRSAHPRLQRPRQHPPQPGVRVRRRGRGAGAVGPRVRGHLLLRRQHAPADRAARGRRQPSTAKASSRSGRPRRCRITCTGRWRACSAFPEAHIRIIACPNGGGFGGKTDICNHEAVVLEAARRLGRPVKICLNREEVFYLHRGRHPVLMKFRTGVTNDGKLTGMHLQTLLDGGGYGSYGAASTFYTGALQTITYELPRYRFEACRTFTNKPPCGPKRGHGTPQPRFGQEVQLDKIAEKLRLDPAELRLGMVAKPNTLTANWLKIGSIGLAECIRQVVDRSGWKSKHGKLPRRAGRGARLRRLHVRRRPADLLEQVAALRRAGAGRPQRPGDRVLRRDRGRPGLGRRPGGNRRRGARHRSVRHPLRDRRHRHHADRSRFVLEPRHRDDGQRGDPGGGARARIDRGRRCGRAAHDAGPNRAGAGARVRCRRCRQEHGVSRCGPCWPRPSTARSERSARTRRPSRPRATRAAASVRRRRTRTPHAWSKSTSIRSPAGFTCRRSGSRTTSGAR